MNTKLSIIFFYLIVVIFPFNALEARFYFLHIPKTGGTTLRLMLELQVSSEEIYPFRNRKKAKAQVEEGVVSGHFPYWFCTTLDKDFVEAFKVTILRDPIERYLSLLRAKKQGNEKFHDLESVLHQRLKHKYREDLIDNALCRNLSADPLLEGEELLESAKQTLQAMDCVIFFDNFSQDIINLFNRLDIDLEEKEIPKMNFTQKEPISDELLDKIKQLNLLDTQLYAYAKACLQKKDTLYPLRTKTFDKILKKSSDIDYSFNLPLKGRGWSYREVTEGDFGNNSVYRWVTDQPAHIYFSLEEGIDYDFSFTAQTLTSEISPKTSVNGREIELSQEANDLFSIYRGKIPKSYLTHEPVEIVFYSSKAFLYKDAHPSHQNRNYPLLSFAINNIKIVKE